VPVSARGNVPSESDPKVLPVVHRLRGATVGYVYHWYALSLLLRLLQGGRRLQGPFRRRFTGRPGASCSGSVPVAAFRDCRAVLDMHPLDSVAKVDPKFDIAVPVGGSGGPARGSCRSCAWCRRDATAAATTDQLQDGRSASVSNVVRYIMVIHPHICGC